MIAHWPNGVSVPGTFNRERGHVRDFHATFRELASAELPAERNGEALLDNSASISMVAAFSGKPRPNAPFYYQNIANGKTALVIDKWKLVDRKFLFDLETDRIESNDLSESHPEIMEFMLAEWKERDTELNNGKASGSPKQK